MRFSKVIIIITIVIVIIGFLAWLFIESSKPLPGQKFPDEGRDHIEVGKAVDYKTNPPTSGKHYADWLRTGVYSESRDDRNLVHSLEHGYIIMSYNCDKSLQSSVSSGDATDSAMLSENFRSDDCHKLVDDLIKIFEKKDLKKLIIIPRSNLDSRIALTAWNYLDKFNEFDQSRIEKFIDAHRDMGPERTME